MAESLSGLTETEERIGRLEAELARFAERSSHRPVIRALQALRGVSLITALGIVVELGDITRFDRPERLMSYAGLVPREYSSGSSRHQGGLTKTGNNHLRWLLIEASWHYRHHPRVGVGLGKRQDGVPEEVKRIAWRAQLRLHHKFRRVVGRGKPRNKAVAAVARELLGFDQPSELARSARCLLRPAGGGTMT
jgi:transposase